MMTDVTSLVLGLLAIGSIIMCIWLPPVIRAEATVPGVKAWNNRAFWLSIALWVHPMGALSIFAATLFSGPNHMALTSTNYLLWAGWTLWLASKTAVIHVLGRLRLALGLYGLWIVFWLILRGFV